MRAVTITLAALGALGCTPLLGEHEPPTLQVDAGTDAASQDSCEGVATELRCEVEGATCSERTLTVCSRDPSGCLRVERTDCGATGETCDAAAAACAPCHGPEACSFERRCDGGDLVTCGPDALGCYVETRSACDPSTLCHAEESACVPRPVGITAGWTHACALWADGTVSCWGGNRQGQLGDGTTEDRLEPTPVEGLEGVVQISGGAEQTCAVLGDGSVRCWGYNTDGRLGDNTTMHRLRPTAVVGLPEAVTAISGYGGHVCALLESGAIACWGYNGYGQLGPGVTEDHARVPVLVPGITGARAVATGSDHSCALLEGGEVRCWGQNTAGQLGDGWPRDRSIPAAVEGVGEAAVIAVGLVHSCASAEGSVRCWGYNDRGQLGVEAPRLTRWAAEPVVTGATAVAAGGFHSCALLEDGAVSCWGDNRTGALGDGTLSSRATPGPVAGLSEVTALAAGRGFSCAISGGGTAIDCWGDNSAGQLGVGTTEPHAVPVRVFGDPTPAGSCTTDSDCPPATAPCAIATCDAGTCTVAVAPEGTECRQAWGGCDLPESCDGESVECPADVVAEAGAQCTTGVGCGTGEACDGASPLCPSDPYCAGDLGIPGTGDPAAVQTEIVVPADTPLTLHLVAPRNLLVNGGGETGDTRGWAHSIPNGHISSERRLFGRAAFIGSFTPNTLRQTVDLVAAGVLPAALDAHSVSIAATQFARGGEQQSDEVRLVIDYLAEDGSVLGTYDSGELTAVAGVWQAIGVSGVDYPAGTRALRFAITTRDGEYWDGHFGAILDGASIIVGSWEMQLSNDGLTWSAWEPFASVKSWTLLPGEGPRAVSVRFRDAVSGELAGAAHFEVTAEAM